MKKFLGILLVFVSLVSCSNVEGNNDDRYVIGFSQCANDMWRQIMMIQMEAEMSRTPDLHLIIKNAGGNTDTQISQIDSLIEEKVDLLIISPNESSPVTPMAVKAFRSGIPTIIWDRKIESDEYTTYISADNYEIGRNVGSYIRNILPEGSSILEISGLIGSSPAQERHSGFMDILKGEYSVRTIAGDWRYEVAKPYVEDITDYSALDLVFGQNDDMALAAYDAIHSKSPGDAERIIFVGIDAVVGVDAIIDGRLDASFLYPPRGEFVIQKARDILNGEKIEKTYTLPTSLITGANAITFKSQTEQMLLYQSHINHQKKELDSLSASVESMSLISIISIVFVIFLLVISFFTFSLNRKLKRKNSSLEKQNEEISKRTDDLLEKNALIENLSNQKLAFFTNISHEIRTPLTLIINPLNKIAKSISDDAIQKDIWTIQRNAKHLLKIVNQILDFRKLENNKVSLLVREVDIVAFTEEILKYFEAYAQSEKIICKFISSVKDGKIWIDSDKIEQVLINLISNAFKNSKKYGVITVSLTENEDKVYVEVHDTGRGMDLNTQERVFDRFFSIDDGRNHGIGIGLHLSKEYVEMHNGRIYVESEPEKFTSFIIELPKFKNGLPEDAKDAKVNMDEDKVIPQDDITISTMLSKKYEGVVLLAEDDEDIRDFLLSELSENFEVMAVSNGYDAIQAVMDNDISIILSDVLMPNVNGFQLCHEIKTNMATSHIPVILLTALTNDSQKIYGIAEGADEYIRKPFDINYVKIKIIRILEERKSYLKKITRKFNEEKFLDVSIKNTPCADDIFRDHLLDYMETNFSDENKKIEDISKSIGISRVHLYRKTKAIFGLTPTELFKKFKLGKGVLFLKENKWTISEVAYMCGFASPAYFTRCFKDVYGISPTQYKASLK